ncbi:MAG: cytochrome P460 family protein [Candidatus Nitrohelix vancouverensis]|uniref:Cytochrome P460 family protein n=1 Tax=Candidatus Nitrohelix vancouverensis TaxID=2705534 RepID=A0A7T0C097_9BACT|nr:MAG: cytochrome P460 family protein [Candidatus Nitrohelix vancouverensis]
MIKYAIALITIAGFMTAASVSAESAYAPNVNMKTGAIQVPEDYTSWATLGTWSHANEKGEAPGAQEFHVVYTQPETIEYYRKHKAFPDGAVLVKELLTTKTMPMTTGLAVSHATSIKGWFVLVRDTQGRFAESKLWGDGWGWSFFSADSPKKTSSTDYKKDCVSCHLPARELAPKEAHDADKWIYTFGYLALQKK